MNASAKRESETGVFCAPGRVHFSSIVYPRCGEGITICGTPKITSSWNGGNRHANRYVSYCVVTVRAHYPIDRAVAIADAAIVLVMRTMCTVKPAD